MGRRSTQHGLSPAVLVGLALVMSLNVAASAQVPAPVSLSPQRDRVATAGERRQALAYWVGVASEAAKTMGLTPSAAIGQSGATVASLDLAPRAILPRLIDDASPASSPPASHLIDLPPPML